MEIVRSILRTQVANDLDCSEEDLVWSENCLNPKTTYNHPDGTVKGQLGYFVKIIKKN
jgi:hypothetical protein